MRDVEFFESHGFTMQDLHAVKVFTGVMVVKVSRNLYYYVAEIDKGIEYAGRVFKGRTLLTAKERSELIESINQFAEHLAAYQKAQKQNEKI